MTLIDRRNFHLFQPLLYQVATGGLSPANIAAPLRVLLKRQANAEVHLGEVVDIDVANHQVVLTGGAESVTTRLSSQQAPSPTTSATTSGTRQPLG